mgnify:FL=1
MNHKCETKKKLLRPDGCVDEPGWANSLVYEYSPFDVKANKLRIKEWDYYIIVDDNGYAFCTVIADNRYMGLANSSFYDFNEGKKYDFITPLVMPMGSMHMPTDSSKGDIYFRSANCELAYIHVDGGRRLTGRYKKCLLHDELEFDLFLKEFKDDDTMVIATPWQQDKKAFYYNQKINCMPASGYVRFGGKSYEFTPERNYGTIDWGRGVWTYDNTWYWGSGNGTVNGKRFGYNIGYGFGDTTAASENILFYDGKCHKLDDVKFNIPASGYTDPWTFTSSDGRFEMEFTPIIDRAAKIDVKLIVTDQHQVFGRMNGKAILDDGTVIEVKDMLCFAEDVHNKY